MAAVMIEVQEEKRLSDAITNQVRLFDSLREVAIPKGYLYLPDENDPAWPSKSGQAD